MLTSGTTAQLAATVTVADEAASKAVTWSSSNISVATVDSSGNLVPLDLDKEAAKGDAKHVLTLFIDNITLHEAEHIPLFHPNVRMKFYHSNDKPDDVDTYSLRKMGAVIEYR